LVPLEFEPEIQVHPTLPDGQVITGKNTLQSFDVERDVDQRTPVVDPTPDSRDGGGTVVAVAVPTEPSILYAEVEPISSAQNQNAAPPVIPWYKRRSTLFLGVLSFLAVVAAAGMGAYIGTSSGKNDSAAGSTLVDSSNATAPFNAPISRITNAPSVTKPPPVSPPMAVVDTNAPTVETNTPVRDPTVFPTMVNVTAPSSPSATVRTDVLTSFVNNISFSNPNISPNDTTPASRALAWMIANDTELDTAY
jgi:hypothetical protein